MREADFKVRYKADMEAIGAPKDLVARTKEKVAAEVTLEKARKKKYKSIYAAAVTAAAAIAVLVGAYAFPDNDNKIALHAGENKQENDSEGEVRMEETAVLPMEFLNDNAWKEEINGKITRFTTDDEGNYIAAYEETEGYVVIYSQIKDAEEIRGFVEELPEE